MCLLGPDHHEVAVNCNNLAAVLERRGPLVEAEALYQRALGAKERTLGPDHPALALTLNNLAVNHRRQGHHREAEAPLNNFAMGVPSLNSGCTIRHILNLSKLRLFWLENNNHSSRSTKPRIMEADPRQDLQVNRRFEFYVPKP